VNDIAQTSLLQKYEAILICNARYLALSRHFRTTTSYYQRKKFSLHDLMKNTEEDITHIKAVASEEQKIDPLFNVLISIYPREQFVRYLINEANLNNDDVKKLIELNTLMRNYVTKRDWLFKAISGAILGSTLLLLNQVPKEVFDYFGWNYVNFKITILIISVLVLLLFTSLTLFVYFTQRKLRSEYLALEYILSWCLIFTDNAQPDKGM
jgi:uncharacterized Tic20 family protein